MIEKYVTVKISVLKERTIFFIIVHKFPESYQKNYSTLKYFSQIFEKEKTPKSKLELSFIQSIANEIVSEINKTKYKVRNKPYTTAFILDDNWEDKYLNNYELIKKLGINIQK